MSVNPVAACIVGLGAVGLIIAIRGTQDNVWAALTGTPAATSTTNTNAGSGQNYTQYMKDANAAVNQAAAASKAGNSKSALAAATQAWKDIQQAQAQSGGA